MCRGLGVEKDVDVRDVVVEGRYKGYELGHATGRRDKGCGVNFFMMVGHFDGKWNFAKKLGLLRGKLPSITGDFKGKWKYVNMAGLLVMKWKFEDLGMRWKFARPGILGRSGSDVKLAGLLGVYWKCAKDGQAFGGN
ncbi:hypothetical protein SUGI_1049410 [Cryptomeria japonica]|nr:hypothetical protein SUGI_1049410 [Cryptomeria japonica]